jgi:hypothetical protein
MPVTASAATAIEAKRELRVVDMAGRLSGFPGDDRPSIPEQATVAPTAVL